MAEVMDMSGNKLKEASYGSGPVLGVGLPISWPYVHTDWVDSWIGLDNTSGCHIIRCNSGPIDDMRNSIVEKALEMGCTHLLFLDADMVLPPDTIPKLLAHDKPVVGALTFKRWPPFNPLLLIGEPGKLEVMLDYPDDELVPVTATGCAVLMIQTSVFTQLDFPWFEFTKDERGMMTGEDIGFCFKCGKKGLEVMVDTGIKTGHITTMTVNEQFCNLNKKLVTTNQAGFGFVGSKYET